VGQYGPVRREGEWMTYRKGHIRQAKLFSDMLLIIVLNQV
jgi:hypothetical protein